MPRLADRAYLLLAVLWGALVIGGYRAVLAYKGRPGPVSSVPAVWPTDTQIPRATDRPTLLVAVHPRCPCTRATVSELERLLARVGSRIATRVLVVKPAGTEDGWADSAMRKQLDGIPTVAVTIDDDGEETARFHLATSGEVVLYDPHGRLLFAGGVTPARGHEGDSVGRASLIAFIEGTSQASPRSPVFGCPLTETSAP